MSIIAQSFGTTPGGKPVDPAQRVDQHFQALHDFVTGAEGKPAQLEAAIGKIAQVYQGLSQAANAPNQGAALLGMVPAGQWQRVVRGRRRRRNATAGAVAEHAEAGRRHAADRVAEQRRGDRERREPGAVGRLAIQGAAAVPGRVQSLPVRGQEHADVPLDDFIRLLGPAG